MSTDHKGLQHWMKESYQGTYDVSAEATDGRNHLPNRPASCYEPDVIIRDQHGEIRFVVEVEASGTIVRKSVVGAAILADYSIGVLPQNTKPTLYFVVCSDQAKKCIGRIRDRIRIARQYCANLADIVVCTDTEFMHLRL